MMTYEEKLLSLAEKDERIMVLTAENRAAIRNCPKALGSRFLDVGITESTMIGAAAGLALRGRIPVVHALSTFLVLRPYEFIRTDVGIGRLPVKMVGWVPGFLSDGNGPTHQAIDDIAVLRPIPGMELFCPADHEDWVLGLEAAIHSPRPVYIRANPRKAVVEHQPFEWGKAETFGDGTDVALLTYGTLFTEVWKAREELESRGVKTRLVNLRTLEPFDDATVKKALSECGTTVLIEDHFRRGALFTIVAELTLRERMAPRVLSLALDGDWFHAGRFDEVLEAEGFTAARIAEKVHASLSASAR